MFANTFDYSQALFLRCIYDISKNAFAWRMITSAFRMFTIFISYSRQFPLKYELKSISLVRPALVTTMKRSQPCPQLRCSRPSFSSSTWTNFLRKKLKWGQKRKTRFCDHRNCASIVLYLAPSWLGWWRWLMLLDSIVFQSNFSLSAETLYQNQLSFYPDLLRHLSPTRSVWRSQQSLLISVDLLTSLTRDFPPAVPLHF